ncbi:MAG: undecaprenyldiphospho-muramoylpentapeptide beta-N-acetylglucosaminyltransferase [Fibrobacterota bacterium]
MSRMLFVCGGTGGHVYPAIAVAEAVRRHVPGAEITFVGKRLGFEVKVIIDAGFPCRSIRAEGFDRTRMLRNLRLLYVLPLGFAQALRTVLREKPDLVFGTGGYVCVPVLAAALLLRKPITLHALDSYPGVAIRFFARFARRVYLGYREASAWLPRRSAVLVTGNPIRETTWPVAKNLRAEFSVPAGRKVVLVVGGSQGAVALNRMMMDYVAAVSGRGDRFVLWQTGNRDFEFVQRAAAAFADLRLFPYINNMYDFYRAADVIVCRAGAMTIAELAKFGLPAVFVPLPSSAGDHQRKNAETIEKLGGGVCAHQKDGGPALIAAVEKLLSSESTLAVMRARMQALHREDAARAIAMELGKEASHG